jgi:DNA-directed RNA polymerase subunit RPC12/RpoP
MQEWFVTELWTSAGRVVVVLVGAVVGLWAVFGDPARGRVRCARCWYDLSGAGTSPVVCPECGKLTTKARQLRRSRRRWRVAIAALMMTIGVWWADAIVRNGFIATVPAPILDLVMSTCFAQEAKAELAAWDPDAAPAPGAWSRAKLEWEAARQIDRLPAGELWPLELERKSARLAWQGDERVVSAIARSLLRSEPWSEHRFRAISLLAQGGTNSRAALGAMWGVLRHTEDPMNATGIIKAIQEVDPRFVSSSKEERASWYRWQLQHRLLDRPAQRALADLSVLEGGPCEEIGRAWLDSLAAPAVLPQEPFLPPP